MTQFTIFVRYYRPYRRLLLADLLCALIAAGATLLLPLAARAITEQVTGTAPADAPLSGLVVLMLVLVGIQTAAGMVVDYHGHRMGALIESDMRADLFAHYQRLPFAFHDEQKTGQLMARITSDLFAISELAHHGPEDFAIAVVKALGAFAILFAIDAALTLIVFAFLPVMAVYAFFFHRRMMQALRRSYERIADINAQVEDTLAGIRVVQSFTNTGVEQAKFTALNQRFVDSRSAGYRSETFFSSGLNAFTELITLAVIAAGGAAIASGRLTAADLVTFLLCVAILVDPIQRAINLARLLQEGATGFSRFTEMLAVQPTITDAPDAIALTDVRGAITFEQVSFRYKPDLPDVLSGVDLTIRAGDYVALVGSSGVGKTTLCALIPRFYDVTSGTIRIDGHDVRGVTLASLRQAIGIVQQDVYLFAGTVADNLRYGRLDATDAEIMAAAKLAHAHDFIMALPHGYATDIGQRGVKLSGGQKQRLSIARALLKDPPILIFDEATSALDADSERAVQDALEAVAHGRTLIVIAHRPSTIARAGRVLALTDIGLSEVTPSALPEP